jgi:hypothetical protein
MLKTKTTLEPSQLISIEKAKELHENFNATRSHLHKKAMGKEDANALWYSLETLENYIAYIKTEGEKKGYDVDGIRFYFGVYSDSENADKAGHTTMFLSPTGNTKKTNVTSKTVASDATISRDITELQPMNFGTMGNPPKMEYGE